MSRFTKIGFRFLDLLVIVMMIFGAPMSTLAAPSPTGATIASDKADYSAGASVTLTGTGWAAGESVHIVVNDTIGQTWKRDVTVTADDSGNLTDVFSLPSYFVSDYDVTASGPVSGDATTTFTDAPADANLDQCRNGSAASPNDCKNLGGGTGWVNGNVGASQAHMLEGYSTPFREVMSNLPTNTSITLTIGYDIRNSGANAYDYLTSYQRLEPHTFFGHPAETVLPLDGITGVSATTSTFAIPAPSSAGSPVAGQPTASFNSLPASERVMTLFGGTITDISYVSQGSLTANQSETQIAVTFTTDSSTAVLAWGGHISQCSVWGTTNGVCNSAGGISGSPYHMRNISWTDHPANPKDELPNLGNTDRSMAAAVVVQPGNLTLAKSLTGGPSGYTGPFTINYSCTDGTAGSVSVNAGSSQTVNGIASGAVCTISETPPTPPTGYTFGTPTFSPSSTVTIGAGTTVTVTTNNTLTQDQGYLKITKSFDAKTSGFNGTFAVVYNCGAGDVTVNLAAGGSTTVGPFATGTSCTVSEPTLPTAPSGWTFGTPSVSGSPATIVKGDQASAVVVTVTNSISRDQGYLKITKSFDAKTSGFNGTFDIVYNCGAGDQTISLAAGGSTTVGPFATGTSCTVSEPTLPAAPSGWTFGTASVSGSPATIVKGDQASAVVVTVTNSITRDLGSLVLAKSLTGGPAGYTGPFTIHWDCGSFGSGDETVSAGGSATISNIPTGTSCTVSETPPPAPTGYSFGTPTFSPSATVTIPAGNGSSITVTTNNTLTRDTGSLTIAKTLSNPDGAQVPSSFTINYDCGTGYTGSVSVAAGGSQTVSGIPTGNTCTVSEAALTPIDGYTWGTPTVTPASVVIADTTSTFTLTVANSITRDLGSLVLAKSLSGGPSGYTGPFTINYDCGTGYTGSVSVAAGSSQTVSGIPTGTSCTVSETLPNPPAGYSFGTPTFSPSDTVTIPAGSGSSVTVTTNNTLTRDLGSLVLAKSLSGGPSGYTGPFTINYDCDGNAYDGSVQVDAGSSQTISGIPTGTSCTISETLPTPPTGYSFGTPTFSPSDTVTIPAGNGSSVTVTTNNTLTRDLGSLKISKTLSNPDGANVPASFTVNYSCDDGTSGQASVAPNSPATVNNIPTGTTCTVTEVAPAAIPGYTWGTITYTPASVVISTKGGTFEITVGNSITRDRGALTIVKNVVNDNGGTASVSAFGINTSAGSLTFDSGAANGTTTTYTSQKLTVVTGNYTLKENDVYGYTEGTWSCTGAAGTVVPTFNNGSVQVGKDEDVTCTITNDDQPGTIIVIKNAKPAQGSFAFTTTGTGYNGFTLTGSTANNGNKNTQILNAGTYTVKESTQLGWILTGIGGSSDPNTPYNCTVTGSGGSTGVGDLNTQTATISLKNGDTVTCVFENTGQGVTRTQGFWATHPQLAQIAWFGGTAFGHTFPGVANTAGIGDTLLCGRNIDTLGKLMGGFWSDISKTSTGKKRSALDQARMQLLQQLLAAELNASAFGSVPSSGSFAAWEAAYCGTNTNAIKTAQQQAASFNSAGDSGTFTPGTSADSKTARSIAAYTFWDVLP